MLFYLAFLKAYKKKGFSAFGWLVAITLIKFWYLSYVVIHGDLDIDLAIV